MAFRIRTNLASFADGETALYVACAPPGRGRVLVHADDDRMTLWPVLRPGMRTPASAGGVWR
ncbi:Spi family protease inhibitor [Hephaestia mangrovi]|uniref:Spi family protease inhibitor n=1 Tax=Hephaestia mangrovi TaxID=2873268 RepID=UPI001CA708E3|nr:Spi family protease inhibitor [Hephaestia mangrovi]MBY8828521.1 Spi family protease inhibitor [Hephaestia mangrovi]